MPWDRKRLLGYVETIQFILGVTDKHNNFVELKQNMSLWERGLLSMGMIVIQPYILVSN